ncbi:MAG: phage Gp37/Gp68 family protein [Bacteroidetes bacterium]|nr:phage Gp37/Gp68 family protein [Bacteroidota bacterium]
MAQSSIEWTELTWNPTTGCSKISAGCKFCYAEIMSMRLKAMGQEKYKNGFKLTLHPDELKRPYEWKKPSTVFVNSMSDLFHKDVPLSFIKKVFKVMNDTPQHTYQILTKRGDVLYKYNTQLNWTKNIWMGVSVENEKVVERIDYLRKTHAQVKFLSLEPLIGPLNNLNLKNIHWVIVGGESGPKAREIKFEWVWDIKKQCKKANVLFFFKQWGRPKFNINPDDPTIDIEHKHHAKGGSMLNGRTYREMPNKSVPAYA